MSTYKFSFSGRQVGAIGAFSFYIEDREGQNAHNALMKLYDDFEHIRLVKVENKETGATIPLDEVR